MLLIFRMIPIIQVIHLMLSLGPSFFVLNSGEHDINICSPSHHPQNITPERCSPKFHGSWHEIIPVIIYKSSKWEAHCCSWDSLPENPILHHPIHSVIHLDYNLSTQWVHKLGEGRWREEKRVGTPERHIGLGE